MEVKKNKHADLENKRSIFFMAGLLIVLSLLMIGFEWATAPVEVQYNTMMQNYGMEEEMAPITRQKLPPPPPPPTQQFEQINIADNTADIIESDIELTENEHNTPSENNSQFGDEEATDDEIFYRVEQMPQFQGGDIEKFRKWFYENLIYPPEAVKRKIQGKIYLQFAINTFGEVCDVQINSGIDPVMDNEVLRLIKSSPPWTPGMQRGRPVKVQFNFPVVFVLP